MQKMKDARELVVGLRLMVVELRWPWWALTRRGLGLCLLRQIVPKVLEEIPWWTRTGEWERRVHGTGKQLQIADIQAPASDIRSIYR